MKQENSTLNEPTTAAAFLFGALGTAIPALIALYWPSFWLHPVPTPLAFRVGLIGISAVLAFMCGRHRLSGAEIKLAGMLAVVCILWLATALASVDIWRALQGWIKLIVLCLVALFVSRALRNPFIAKGFGRAMIAASVFILVFIVFSYVRLVGLTMPTYELSRQFKGLVLHAGIPLNAIAMTALMAYITGACLLPKGKYTWALGVVVLYISSAFTGSRAPLGVFVLTGFGLLITNWLRSRKAHLRWQAYVLCVAVLAGTAFAFANVSFKKMSDITEGRWDLWYVAVQKFSERPLVGWGFESVDDDLFARQPGVYKLPRRKDGKFPGGYHNEYVGALAEEGLIGFTAVVALYWFLMRSCWQLAFLKWGTWHNGQWALIGGLFLLFRAFVEVPGLFGYANGPPDFQAYIFLAFVVSRFSLEEDFALKAARQLSGGSAPDESSEAAEVLFAMQEKAVR